MQQYRLAVLVLLVLAWLAPASSAAAQVTVMSLPPSGQDVSLGPRSVVTTAAGGISKGAYQAGVDWTISEFLRRERNPGLGTDSAEVPRRYALAAATGASAGNVNALISALAWCTEAPATIAPEESLFWKVWIGTGISRLMPDTSSPSSEPAVFDRAFFDEYRQELNKAMESKDARYRKGCAVPVGVTLTKVVPEPVRVQTGETPDGPGGTATPVASVQRFASVFVVKSHDGRLRFERFVPGEPGAGPDRLAPLGALALLPQIEFEESDAARLDAVMRVLMASSSFPVAFAPVPLRYIEGGLLGSQGVKAAAFTDGGVFDNNPLGLAAGLHEAGLVKPSDGSAVLMAYSSPGTLRGGYADWQHETKTADPQGLSAAFQILAGAFSAARDYELQSFSRQLHRDAVIRGDLQSGPPVVEITMASRSGPIVGEMLGSFAGFFGRPFREFDFYAGVYDGLEFVSRTMACSKDSPRSCPTEVLDGYLEGVGTDDACRSKGDDDKKASGNASCRVNYFHLDTAALSVVRWRRDLERALSTGHPSPPLPGVPELPAPHQPRLAVLWKIHAALWKLAASRDHFCGTRDDALGSKLCKDGLDLFLRTLHDDHDLGPMADAIAEGCRNDRRDALRCFADPDFRSLVRNPRRHVFGVLQDALRRLRHVEASLQSKRHKSLEWLPKAAILAYRSLTPRYQTGALLINPSSAIRETEGFESIIKAAVDIVCPNYVAMGGARGQRTKDGSPSKEWAFSPLTSGWRVASRPGEWLGFYGINAVFELSRYEVESDPDRKRRLSPTYGVSFVAAPPVATVTLTSLEVGALWSTHVWSVEQDTRDLPRTPNTLLFAGRFFADRLYASVRVQKGGRFVLSAGLSDLNGLISAIIQ